MPFFRPITLLLACCLLYTCTPDQRTYGRQAEQAYVDLFYAIHNDKPALAKTAAQALDSSLVTLRYTWQRPYREERLDNILYHLDQAGWIYAEARASIEDANLELAGVQLDRATYELTAASPATIHELYIGAIYDFLITWIEVQHAVGEPDLCSLEWTGFSSYAKDVRITWRRVRSIRPHAKMYGSEAPIDLERFELAHASVEVALEKFEAILQTGDQCLAANKAEAVSASIWELILLFGSEANGGV